jgi:hypothetical protein
MERTKISAGILKRDFPIATGNLRVGGSVHVAYYGDTYKITRTGDGPYDLTAHPA